jgi:hypothetical protein
MDAHLDEEYDDLDSYDYNVMDELVENDEMSDWEAGFLHGEREAAMEDM